MNDSWFDGLCKTCGWEVEEESSEDGIHDYQNRCKNPACIEHKWHYCYDSEFLEYYEHGWKSLMKSGDITMTFDDDQNDAVLKFMRDWQQVVDSSFTSPRLAALPSVNTLKSLGFTKIRVCNNGAVNASLGSIRYYGLRIDNIAKADALNSSITVHYDFGEKCEKSTS